MYYYANRKRAQTRNTSPTLTDQAGARDTDINVIVGRFVKTGTVTAAKDSPMSGDFTQLPTDLAGFIKEARKLRGLTATLPDKLKNMSTNELLALTPQQLADLAKPEPPAEPKDENK